MADMKQLSRTAYDRLRGELDELTTEGRIDIARKIEAARALGDLSENGDYHAAKDHQGKMEARIRQLQGLLLDVEVVDQAPATDHVSMGTVVQIRFEGDADPERYLVGSIEERRPGLEVVSPGSPLGQALLGAVPGDRRSYSVNGNDIGVEILAIEA